MTNDTEQESALLLEVERLTGTACACCGRRLCGHHVVLSMVLGLKTTPYCLSCSARQLERDTIEMREQLTRYVLHRDCYRRAWENVVTCSASKSSFSPTCLGVEPSSQKPAEPRSTTVAGEHAPTAEVAATWDAGDLGCGDLVLGLRGRLLKLEPGAVLKLVARDPAAPEDLPAWCRLTGHRLLAASHPTYFIERKRG